MPLVETKDDEEEVKGDMTPMIDIIFLLLIFFILTTKFVPNEKAIASLMPTNKGQSSAKQEVVEPPEDINIRLWPVGMGKTAQPSELDAKWAEMLAGGSGASQVVLQIGGGVPLKISGAYLDAGVTVNYQEGAAAEVHEYIKNALQQRERAGQLRAKQDPVVIHCFSGLAWKYALIAYDAVRNYEGLQSGVGAGADPTRLGDAREVNFAPPRVRNYHTWEHGNEIYEIMNLK